MAEYIEKEKASLILREEAAAHYPTPYHVGLLAAARAIESIPAGDVRPVEWIPVKERLPQICTNVLVAGMMKYRWEHKYLQFVDKAFFNEGEFFETSNDWYEGQDEFEITHWMPLPEPPKEE